jgi:hypothetical protein
MSPSRPPHWTNPLFELAAAFLAIGIALHLAAALIVSVLPVLIPVAILGLIGWGVWRYVYHRRYW